MWGIPTRQGVPRQNTRLCTRFSRRQPPSYRTPPPRAEISGKGRVAPYTLPPQTKHRNLRDPKWCKKKKDYIQNTHLSIIFHADSLCRWLIRGFKRIWAQQEASSVLKLLSSRQRNSFRRGNCTNRTSHAMSNSNYRPRCALTPRSAKAARWRLTR